jgi:hypothetical protein
MLGNFVMIIKSENEIHQLIDYYGAEDFVIAFVEKLKGNAYIFKDHTDWYVMINRYTICGEPDNLYSVFDPGVDDWVAYGTMKEMIEYAKSH